MTSSNKFIVQMIVNQCKKNGIHHIVFSPGSRNAPFAISFDHMSDFKTHVIHDERVAAFYAIGMAQMLNVPVALCCTSGSAVVNYYPAITEAFYRKIPLLVISADRPKELINKGHGQSIMQNAVFGDHVKCSYSFEDLSKNKVIENGFDEQCQNGISVMSSEPKGPVHFNVHLNEPLYETTEDIFSCENLPVQENKKNFKLSQETIAQFENKRILVLCGQNSNQNNLNQALSEFNNNTNVVVLNENTSHLHDPKFINCIDRTLNSISHEKEKQFAPDILISVGDAIVSKRIKAFFKKHQPGIHIAVNHSNIGIDSFDCLSHHFKTEAADFFKLLNQSSIPRNTINFESKWRSVDLLVRDRMPGFFNLDKSRTDIHVFHHLNENLKQNDVLHLANSSVVRYMQLFDSIKSLVYHSNRGTSGIDGSMSTAVGSAIASSKQRHLFVTGDISFIYDSNALWIRPFPKNIKIIVIDNRGGGIFRIIDGPKTSKQLENYFEAQHKTDPSLIAKGYGFKVMQMGEKDCVEETIKKFLNEDDEQILIVPTEQKENPLALQRFFNYLKDD